MPRKTTFFAAHKKLGATMVEFGPWLMPLYYTSIIAEHTTVRNKVGLFDVSHMGEFLVRGNGALAFVQRLITNDASRLEKNQALYTPMCNDNGTIIDDLLVYRFSDRHFMLVGNASNIEKDYRWMEGVAGRFTKEVILENISDETSLLALQGPGSQEVLQRITDLDLAGIRRYWFREGEVAGSRATVSRTGYTGEDGFEIYLNPEHALEVWNKILSIGREEGIKPAGLGARDTLRLECAMLLYGSDLDETRTPLEANIAWTVKFDKKDFMGKKALLREKQGEIREKLIAFELLERGVPRHGYPVLKNRERIGMVTSGGFSPTLKKGIGLGYVKAGFAQEGDEIQIQIRERMVRAEIVKTPFYKRKNA